jgi:hypothetical protein
MNADIRRENEKHWEKTKGLLVGESAAVFFAGQTNPYSVYYSPPKAKERKEGKR